MHLTFFTSFRGIRRDSSRLFQVVSIPGPRETGSAIFFSLYFPTSCRHTTRIRAPKSSGCDQTHQLMLEFSFLEQNQLVCGFTVTRESLPHKREELHVVFGSLTLKFRTNVLWVKTSTFPSCVLTYIIFARNFRIQILKTTLSFSRFCDESSYPKKLGPPKTGDKVKRRKIPTFEGCALTHSNFARTFRIQLPKLRGVLPVSVFWVICVNRPVHVFTAPHPSSPLDQVQ